MKNVLIIVILWVVIAATILTVSYSSPPNQQQGKFKITVMMGEKERVFYTDRIPVRYHDTTCIEFRDSETGGLVLALGQVLVEQVK